MQIHVKTTKPGFKVKQHIYNVSKSTSFIFINTSQETEYAAKIQPIALSNNSSSKINFVKNSIRFRTPSYKLDEKTMTNFTLKLALSKLHSKVLNYELLTGIREDVMTVEQSAVPQPLSQTNSSDYFVPMILVIIIAILLATIVICLIVFIAYKIYQSNQTNTYWIN